MEKIKSFLEEFLGKGDEIEFANFTPAHFIPIAILLLVIAAMGIFRNRIRNSRYEKNFRYLIAFTLIFSEMSYYWRLVAIPALEPSPASDLPITVCGWCVVFCSYMVIGKSQRLFDLSYFWLLSGTIFALITPTVISYTGPERFRYYQFWFEHTMGYVAIFYMIFVHGMRPNVRSFVRAYFGLALLAGVALFANQLIGPGANYLFMARPESTPSVLDILPPNFALRIAIMASVISMLFVLAYLPWYVKDKKAAIQAARENSKILPKKLSIE